MIEEDATQEIIGFVSTRFQGRDGVSLESAKWAQVLWDYRHVSHWYAGRLDTAEDISLCVPEAHFEHPENRWINERIWGRNHRSPLITRRIEEMAAYLKDTLYEFVDRFGLTMLVIENALSIPMHVPLGVAIAHLLAETRIPAIAHHHDFSWERPRFSVNAINDYIDMAFPPRNDTLSHVVINRAAQEELSFRKGIPSMCLPNVLDFENPPDPIDHYSSDVRASLGIGPEDLLILQPTRVVPRKGIEHAIKLVKMLENPNARLVVSHKADDEGPEYRHMLAELAGEEGVDLRFAETRIGDVRQFDHNGQKMYTLWDLYRHADLITYPSLYEGFGNAFLEAVYFRKPVLINRYSIYTRDIEPRGFRLPTMDGFLTRQTVEEVRRILDDEAYRRQMVEHNYRVATRFFSYSVLRRSLRTLITDVRGLD